MFEMPTLTPGQYALVFNMFSLTIAAMLAAFVFFIMAQSRVAPKYRISLIVSSLVVGIAAYHYIRIIGSWEEAYTTSDVLAKVAFGVMIYAIARAKSEDDGWLVNEEDRKYAEVAA